MDQAPGSQFDVVSCPDPAPAEDARRAADGRPWIGVHFECCGVYSRIYRDPTARRYDASCPKCGRGLCIRVGPDGVDGRFFRATPA